LCIRLNAPDLRKARKAEVAQVDYKTIPFKGFGPFSYNYIVGGHSIFIHNYYILMPIFVPLFKPTEDSNRALTNNSCFVLPVLNGSDKDSSLPIEVRDESEQSDIQEGFSSSLPIAQT
jgi:hypothetical protein